MKFQALATALLACLITPAFATVSATTQNKYDSYVRSFNEGSRMSVAADLDQLVTNKWLCKAVWMFSAASVDTFWPWDDHSPVLSASQDVHYITFAPNSDRASIEMRIHHDGIREGAALRERSRTANLSDSEFGLTAHVRGHYSGRDARQFWSHNHIIRKSRDNAQQILIRTHTTGYEATYSDTIDRSYKLCTIDNE